MGWLLRYPVWLAGMSLLFVVAERIWPRRPAQRLLRRGIWNDLFYLVFNAEYLGMAIGISSAWLLAKFDLGLARWQIMRGAPLWTQIAVWFFVLDFLQWLIHNLLHRVPALWEFHKVHHSIVELDWIGDWRIHWGEIVVYRTLLYVPAAISGISGEAMFWVGVVNTFGGHLAHANLNWNAGWWKYVVNTPEMHAWHHNHPECGPVNRNFGLTLAVWDWIFGTAWLPDHDPARLGFEGIERYPSSVPGQWLAPFAGLLRKEKTPGG